MKVPVRKAPAPLGFLSVVERSELGFVGGLLIVNSLARPLEFHCTAPVRPNRAQEILYGPTLKEFVAGEQIGAALVDHAKAKPALLLTDSAAMLSLRSEHPTPLVCIDAGEPVAADSETAFNWHGVRIFVREPGDQQQFEKLWPDYADSVDLSEPFERIHEALDEAHRGVKAA